MSPHWNASTVNIDVEYDACYTSWWNPKDVTPTTKAYRNSGFSKSNSPSNAIDGFWGIGGSFYTSSDTTTGWFTFELAKSTTVAEVHVVPCPGGNYGHFCYVTVYLGDMPVESYDDLSTHAVFGTFMQCSPRVDYVSFKREGMKGRYLTFASVQSSRKNFSIGEIQIISA